MQQHLDRERPLWETWVVEGLEGDRFALISKVHHCMIDGVSGVDLLQILLSPDPQARPEPPPQWIPRPTPSGAAAAARRARAPAAPALRGACATSAPSCATPRTCAASSACARAPCARRSARRCAAPRETPINGRIGPHRRFDWFAIEIAEIAEDPRGARRQPQRRGAGDRHRRLPALLRRARCRRRAARFPRARARQRAQRESSAARSATASRPG